MRNKIFSILQRVGRSFMLPIALLPVAGLFLGIGSSLTNTTMLSAYHLNSIIGPGTPAYTFLSILSSSGSVIFNNLPLLFALGVAIGMAKTEKAVAALSSTVAFLVMHSTIGQLIAIHGGPDSLLAGATANVIGITSLQMGVFGGIIVGLGVAALHNHFYKIELPQVFAFFGGTRFVPIISALVYLFVGILMFYCWQPVQMLINGAGQLVLRSGYGGTFFYGLLERALIPFGLHHVFYMPFWQTAVGGAEMIGGQLVEGAQNIFFAELASPEITHFNVAATRFMAGKFPLMIFALPGAALAMYNCADSDKKQQAASLLFSAAITSMLTGITEPLEFAFLFASPLLYAIHCVFAGLSFMLMHMLGVGVGMTFSGGFIDLILFGILQGNEKTSWIRVLPVGIIYFAVYYIIFKYMITKFNYLTPGRDGTKISSITTDKKLEKSKKKEQNPVKSGLSRENALHLYGTDTPADMASQQKLKRSADILSGLGGRSNIADIDCCATRLRVTVKDPSAINRELLSSTGAAAIMTSGSSVQVIYGPQVTVILSELTDYMEATTHAAPVIAATPTPANTNAASETGSREIIYAPCRGRVIPLKDVNDGVFSEGYIGQGAAMEPDEGNFYAPFDGTITMVFDTMHAIALHSAGGVEFIIHVGLDTVHLNGQPFKVFVKDGDTVRKGDLLLQANLDAIQNAGYRTITPLIVTPASHVENVQLMVDKNDIIETGTAILMCDS